MLPRTSSHVLVCLQRVSKRYAEAHGKFLVACAGTEARATAYPREVLTGEVQEALATDVASLGSEAAECAAIVLCGTHGSEAFPFDDRGPWLSSHRAARREPGAFSCTRSTPWTFSLRMRHVGRQCPPSSSTRP
ncbi:DUF2817 domain-containing protein [Phreatobacter sp.]|uniref:DUF2817 domain-containing protein n=1 Tax=Phreatobacter sp. TaxID=1966341 RepID=UPI003F71BA96